MDNIIQMNSGDGGNDFENSPEYMEQARKIGDYIDNLNLANEQHNTLVSMLAELISIARSDSFTQCAEILAEEMQNFLDGHEDEED